MNIRKHHPENIIRHLLLRYDDNKFVLQLKARFIAYCYFIELIIISAAIIYTAYANLNNPLTGYLPNIKVLGTLLTGLAVTIAGLIFLVRGYYTAASHLLFICGFTIIWTVIIFDHTHVVSRLDTIVLIVALLTMAPIVILQRPLGIIFYGTINILFLYTFMFFFRAALNLPYSSFISYISDNTLSILAVTGISYQVYTINRRALDKAEKDISERKKAESALRESEQKLRAVFDLTFGFIGQLSPEGILIEVNNTALEFINTDRSEIIGMPFWETPWWSHSVEMQNKLKTAIENAVGGEFVRFEATHTGRDESLHVIDFSLKPVKDNAGFVILLIAEGRDITERKQAEAEKRKLTERFMQVQKMEALGTLAAGIAHDFNNILSAILGYADLTRLDIEENKHEETLKNITGIQTAGLRAKDLIKQILAFSRQTEVVHKPVEIIPLIIETLKILKASLPAKITIMENIPDETYIVKADPTEIHQVVMNLGTNAAHAMHQSGGILSVSIDGIDLDNEITKELKGLSPGKYIRLIIADTGIGIPTELIPKIFDPFFTTKERDKGTGMGLSVVHGIVTAMKGGISVYSEPGKGTAFNIFIPRIERVLTNIEPEIIPLKKGSGIILLVDDEKDINITGAGILQHLGYEVITACNGLEAVEIFRSNPDNFLCMLTDLNLPGINGLDLAKKIKEIRSDIPIILSTGFSHDLSPDELAEAGIKEMVMKPLIASELSEAIWKATADPGISHTNPL